MKTFFIDEPELEFGAGGRHIDIRHGLMAHGTLDRGSATAPRVVRVGVVGSAPDVEALRVWVDRCRDGVDAKESRRTTLFVGFPGFGESGAFCDFVVNDRLVDAISGTDLHRFDNAPDDEFFAVSSQRFREGALNLVENGNADVVVCLLPDGLVKRIDVPSSGTERGPRSRRRGRTQGRFIWHDAIKAESLGWGRPIQVVRPAVYSDGVHHYTRTGKAVRAVQDEATRAWNFFCALYYKAGGVPWRLVREAADLTSCFIGVSFYHDPQSESLQTSVAQVFNERGEGMILRGGPAQFDDRDRSPHLSQPDAESLIRTAIDVYRREHRTMPARLVCHKSSYFSEAEREGCRAAMAASAIDSCDLISLRRSRTRLYRSGEYPPLRGTALVHDEGCFLYTHGSVDFYRCYPGLYVPRTLDVQFDDTEQGERGLLTEILALTKMNWNSTELVNLEPVTLAAARGVGSILQHVPAEQQVQTRYSFFM